MMSRLRQKGVALITVLLVFALLAIIAGQIVTRNMADLRQTASLVDSAQAYYYALGGEALARQILARDFQADDSVDNLEEDWAKEVQAFQLDDGVMAIKVIDLQGLFNLNNLVDASGKVVVAAQEDFIRLLEELNLNTNYAYQLQDWIDKDDLVAAKGAEKKDYADSSYLVANQGLTDRSELRLLLSMKAADYRALRDHVVALPEATTYNLNTLDATILKALAPAIGDADVNSFMTRQQQGGYTQAAGWYAAEGKALAAIGSRAGVASHYFEVRVTVNYADRVCVLRSQLYRAGDGKITVIKRQQGNE